jgi:thiosulfate/3-mercaptopyruvate sulfurtransferase
MVRHIILFIILAVNGTGLALAAKLPGVLVDTNWLSQYQDKVVVLDVRKDVRSFTAKPVFSKDKKTGKLKLKKVGGHIAGARLVNYNKVRANIMLDSKEVTRMILPKGDFEKLMQASGLDQDDTVVIVSKGESNSDMTMATRLYWQLKFYGHDNMAILDGGMSRWLQDGRKFSSEPARAESGNWAATKERKEILATSEDVAKAVENKSAQLIDTRPVAQYLGTYNKSYVYARGHIPGAKNFPNELLTGPSGKASFTSTAQLQELSKALGINPAGEMITYCNSGHLASGSWFLYSELLGNKNVKLYDGSMHQWTMEKGSTVSMKVE